MTNEQFLWMVGQKIDNGEVESWSAALDFINRELLGDFVGAYKTESAWRKKYQAAKKFKKNCFDLEKTDGDSSIKEEIVRLEKERIKIRDERNAYKELIRKQARKESYLEQLQRIVSEHAPVPLEYEKNQNNKYKSDNDLIVSLMDIHAGLDTKNFFNTYNDEVLKRRLRKYLDKIFEVQARHKSENVYVILSELINGLIHNELRIEANTNIIEQFLFVCDVISDFLVELSEQFNTVNVYMCPGNHSRLVQNKEEQIKGENIDNLAIPLLSAKLQNYKNIVFHSNVLDESIASFTVRGRYIFASHGDKDRIDDVVQKYTMMFGTKPDIVYLGHRHTNSLTTTYDSKVIQSGCISGSDAYCMDKRLKNKPEQTISVITNDGLDCLYDVKLS